MRKKVAKFVSYLLVAALVMQDGLPAAAANNLTGRAERMTVLENDSGDVSDKEEAEDKASNNQKALEENADKETPSEEQSEDKKTQKEEKQDDKSSDNEEQSEDKTSEDKTSNEEQSKDKTSEKESATENESSEDEQTTTEESSETETETDIKTTETETETKTTETGTETETKTETIEEETETAVEEKTVKAEEDTSTYVEEYEGYPGDEATVGTENKLGENLFELGAEGSTEFKHWTRWNGFVSAMEVNESGTSITIKMSDTPKGVKWATGIQYKDSLGLENGKAYQISYKITSTAKRKVTVDFDDKGEADRRELSLEANMETTVRYIETAGVNWNRLSFYLGETDNSADYGAHEVTISDLSIKEVTIKLGDGDPVEETEGNLLTNGTFKYGNLDGWNPREEGLATAKCAKYKVVFDITGNGGDWQPWLQQPFEFNSGTKYKISFKAESTVDRYIAAGYGDGTWFQHQYLPKNTPVDVEYRVSGVSGNDFIIALGAHLRASQVYKDWDGKDVPSDSSKENQTLAPHRVTLSNICITELPVELPDTPNDTAPAEIKTLRGYDGIKPSYLAPLKDGKFTRSIEMTMGDNKPINIAENASWKLWHEEWMTANGVECIPVPDGMAFKMNAATGTDDIGNNPWDAQFNQTISLKKDLQYTLSFTVKSEKARSINISIGDIGGADENGNGIPWVKPIAIQKNETREVVLNLPKLTADALDKTFMIQMGHIAGTPDGGHNTLTFTNMKLEVNGYSKLAERIVDGYFNDGDQGNFNAETNNKAEVSFKDSYIHADITEDCANSDVVVSSGKFDLLGNDDDYDYQYEVRFIAGATEDRTIKAMLVNSIGTTLKEESFNLTTEAKQYFFTYKPNTDQKNVSLKLMLGGSKGIVCVDTVRCDLEGYPEAAGLDTDGHDITVLEKKSIPVISEMPANDAVAGKDIVISFDKEGNDTYKDSINEILIDGIKVADDKFKIGERTGESGRNDEYTITLDKSLFNIKENAEEGRQVFTIEVKAPWYLNNKLHQTVYTKKKWTDTWLEEFDGTQLDMTKWSYQTGRGDNNDGWGNREQQNYTNSKRNIKVSNGELLIKARKEENSTAAPYTSARIWTMNDDGKTAKFSQKYGRMEAKMRVDAGKGYDGIWPAFWMLPVDLEYGTWPLSGEIDILEARGREPNLADGTIHFGKPYPNNESSGGVFDFNTSKYNRDSDISDYHIYAVEWEPTEIRWYVDDELYFKESNWYCQSFDNPEKFRYPAPFDQEFYIILNLAIGGMFDNDKLPLDEKMPADMNVDYVRVYESVNGYEEAKRDPIVTQDENLTPYNKNIKSELRDTEFTGINIITEDGVDLKRDTWNLTMLPSFGGSANFATVTKDSKTFAKITPTNLGAAAHAIQLIQHLDLVKGYYYRISFDAYTEGSRSLNMKIGQDGTEGWNAYQTFETALTESPEHYQCEFQAKKTDRNSRVEFNLATSDCPVYIGNIKYEVIDEIVVDPDAEKAPSEDGNCVYNGSFNVGNISGLSYWHMDAGSDGKTVRDEKERGYQFTATKGNLYQYGLQLLKGDSYKMTFSAKAVSDREITVTLSDKDGKSEYLKETATLTSDWKDYTFTFDMTQDTDKNTKLCFVFGDSGAKIDITGIRLEKTTYHNVDWDQIHANPLRNGDFELGEKYWGSHNTTFSVKSDEKNNHYAEVQAKKGGNKWDATFGNDGVSFTAQTDYEFSFKARASKEGESVRVTIQEGAPSYYSHFTLNEVTLGTEWKTYEYDVKFREPHDNLSLTFSVAGASEDYLFDIDDVVISAKGSLKTPVIINEPEGYNFVGTDVVLSYKGDADWEKNAVAYIDDKKVDSSKAVFKNGKLTLDKSLFAESGKYTLIVRSEGYTKSPSVSFFMYPANGNLILNGNFARGLECWDHWVRDDADGNYLVITEAGMVRSHYQVPGGEPQPWAILMAQEGIPVKKNQKYRLSFYVRTTKPRWIQILHDQGTKEQKHEIAENEEIKSVTDELELHSVDFTTTDESNTLKITFSLATVGANGAPATDLGEHDIYLDDICLLELPDDGKIKTDKSTLQRYVDEYAALKDNKNQYTKRTYAVFETAYAEAEVVLAKEDAVQEEVIRAENNLSDAVEGLQELGDKKALRDLIKDAESYEEANYTPASWSIFDNALSEAQKVYNKDEALQDEIDNACNVLIRAENGIVSYEMVKNLRDLITECESYENEGYSASSWERFETALDKAKEAVENEEATNDDITSAQKRLQYAKDTLVLDDITIYDLKELIEQSQKLKEVNYTKDTWKTFNSTLTKAEGVANDSDATNDSIKEVYNKLTRDKASLQESHDITALQELIIECQSKKSEQYTAESWKEFNEVLKEAQGIKNDPKVVSQETINNAYDNLQKARQNLTYLSKTQEDLKGLIKEYESLELKKANYTKNTWDLYISALDKANEVSKKSNAAQDEINEAYYGLVDAKDALEEVVDKEPLKILIEKCDNLNKSDYTSDSWTVLQEALKNAKDIRDKKASLKEVEDAYQELSDANAALKPDKTVLRQKITEAQSKDKNKYTPESWTKFDDALKAAQEILDKEDATLEEVQKACADLDNAMDQLIPCEVTVEDLTTLITDCKSLKEEDYTSDTWKTFYEALDKAKGVAEKQNNATNDERLEAYTDLVSARAALKPDKTTLAALIDECQILNRTDYEENSWISFEVQRDNAIRVRDNLDATLDDIQDAYQKLNDAKAALKPDKTRLQQKITEARSKEGDKDKYTEESWTQFDEALRVAQTVLDKEDATLGEVQNAYTDLDSAMTALRKVDEPSPVDKTELQDLINECRGIENYYLSEDWSEFKEALENAEIVAIDENATQDDIKKAYNNLLTAKNNLKAREKVEAEGFWAFKISDVYYTGKAVKPSVTVYNGKTLLVEKKDYTVTYKNNTKVSKTRKGEAVDNGDKPHITIKGKGNYNGNIEQDFDIIPNDFEGSDITVQDIYVNAPKIGRSIIPAPVVIRNGKKLKLSTTKKKGEYEIIGIYKYNGKNDKGEDIIDTDPMSSVSDPGRYRVKVKGVPENGYEGEREFDMYVRDPKNQKFMSAVKVSSIKSQDYTGQKVEPDVTVKDGKNTLERDTDYTVDYDNNIEIGTARVIITGTGEKYVGKKIVTFKIIGKTIKAKDVTVNASNTVYTGNAIEPEVKVTVAGETLTCRNTVANADSSADYDVLYDKNEKAGNAVVIVTGINGYTGTVKKTFKIAPFDLNSSNDNEHKLELNYNKTEGIKIPYAKGGSKLTEDDLAITFNNTRLTEGVDYTLIYKKNTKVTTDETKASVKIKGKGNFKGTTAEIPFEITQQSLENLRSNITVMDVLEKKAKNYKNVTTIIKDLDGKALKKGTDFEITGFYPTEESKEELTEVPKVDNKVYVVIKGKGNYEGEVREAFRIIGNDKDISKATVKVDPQSYTGNEIKLKDPLEDGDTDPIQVTMKGVSGNLKRGTDYKIVGYSNNINKGSGKITIQGIGSYGGTKTVSFKINAHDFYDMPWYENYYSRIMSWFNESFSQ